MRDDFQHAPAEVTAQDVIDTAIERAARTQHALILAEAQVLWWKREYAEAVKRAEAAEKRADIADSVTAETKRLMDRRIETLRRRAEAAEAGGGNQDGQEDGGESPAAVGEAGPEGSVPA